MGITANQIVLDEQPPARYLPLYNVEGSGPLLIFISGLDGTGQLFFKQSPALARSFRVVTYRSRERGQFTYEDLADDVAAIIKDLGEERATIVAESFGGGVALTFALRHPRDDRPPRRNQFFSRGSEIGYRSSWARGSLPLCPSPLFGPCAKRLAYWGSGRTA